MAESGQPGLVTPCTPPPLRLTDPHPPGGATSDGPGRPDSELRTTKRSNPHLIAPGLESRSSSPESVRTTDAFDIHHVQHPRHHDHHLVEMPPQQPPDADEQQPLLTGSGNHATADGDATDRGVSGGGTFTRNLGTVEAFAIVISIVIGSGVFTSPGSIDTNVPSPGVALAVWLVGGVLAWTGASTLAELGAAIPGEGMDGRLSSLLHQRERC